MQSNHKQSEIVAQIKKHVHNVLDSTRHERVIIAVSGGIDSATALYLLKETIPVKRIYVIHLYYFEESMQQFRTVIDPLNIPKENILLYSIKDTVDQIANELQIVSEDTIRRGNIMARTRMTYLFDQAKKLNALVCGTENRTEHYLGYFTRFGDAASDFEVINHLYKSEVRQLMRYLHIPQEIIDTAPSAGLWEGQTDEKELGFTYDEIDHVLSGYFDEKLSLNEIYNKGYSNAYAIIQTVKKNQFKHKVPYVMDTVLIE